MEADVMTALLEAFEQSDWQEMTVTIGGDQLHVSRQAPVGGGGVAHAVPAPAAVAPSVAPPVEAAAPVGAPEVPSRPPAPAPAPAAVAAPEPHGATVTEPAMTGTPVTSPSVGLFWRAPSPGAPPFVEVGNPVSQGDTVAIVEVMKLMNHVTAVVSGTVTAVLPENGEAVEYGQVLVMIDPES